MQNSEVDNQRRGLYTEAQLERVASMAVETALARVIPALTNLDNCISEKGRIQPVESSETMCSKYRETYSYVDASGNLKQVRLNGRNKQDTDAKFQEYVGGADKPKTPTVREFVDTTYRKSFISHLGQTTIANYELYLKHYILPYLGDMPMGEVSVATVQSFYDWMAEASKHGHKSDINKKSIARISGLASRIFCVAFEMGIIRDTPFKMKLLRNNGRAAGHHVALPDSEVDRVKKRIPDLQDERMRLYMGLLVYTGMRREEILGLRWECLNLQERYGEVRSVVVYPNNAHAVIKDTPKSVSSERTFLIPQALYDILAPSAKSEGFVIHGKSPDVPASPSTMQRTYRQAFKAIGIDGYDNHDWRATFGTQLKERGLTSAQVADLMGHADTRMVETVYARARRDGVMKHKHTLESLNSAYARGTFPTPQNASNI